MSWIHPVQQEVALSLQELVTSKVDSLRNPLLPTLLCFSHLRWNFVYQRPQHLMTRFASAYNVVFFEEPLHTDEIVPWLQINPNEHGVQVLVPRLPARLKGREVDDALRTLLNRYLADLDVQDLVLWYYMPMSRVYSDHLQASVTVYDCMDELSAFRGAPPELVQRERELLASADVVFTGGHSIWEAKRQLHGNAHAFPSSVDIAHFAVARSHLKEPADQAAIGGPRFGFFGVIDERLDIELLERIAELRPAWQFVMIGPVVKIDPATLPQCANIHYLGGKTYGELPTYMAGWDVALMPFALNDSTRFISPTKTPEYLAGGCPVVSTPINDVVRSYGDSGLVLIARTAEQFVLACEQALVLGAGGKAFFKAADHVLGDRSWDQTQAQMQEHIQCLR